MAETENQGSYIREVDGEPWEVAQIAGNELSACCTAARAAFDDFAWAARNSWFSQEYHRTGKMPTVEDFASSPFGRRAHALQGMLAQSESTARTLTNSAAYDPRSR